MRLPPELRIMVYRQTWTVVDCPGKLTVRGGRRWTPSTGVEYWFGSAPGIQVQYPKIIMRMDPRIKKEFASELCAQFPVQMYIGTLFAETIPKLSIHMPSVFLDHLRNCYIEYHPRRWGGVSFIGFKTLEAIDSDIRQIFRFLQLFPSLDRVDIRMPYDHPELIFWHGSEDAMGNFLRTLRDTLHDLNARDDAYCYSRYHARSFYVGWRKRTEPEFKGKIQVEDLYVELKGWEHDVRSCDFLFCRYQSTPARAIALLAEIITDCLERNRRRFRWLCRHPRVIRFCMEVWVITSTHPGGVDIRHPQNIWCGRNLTSFISFEVFNSKLWLASTLLCDAWRNRHVVNNWIHIFLRNAVHVTTDIIAFLNRANAPANYTVQLQKLRGALHSLRVASTQTLPTNLSVQGTRPQTHVRYAIERLVSFCIDLFLEVLFEVYIHINVWAFLAIAVAVALRLSRSYLLKHGEYPEEHFGRYYQQRLEIQYEASYQPNYNKVLPEDFPLILELGGSIVIFDFCPLLPFLVIRRQLWGLARSHRARIATSYNRVKIHVRDFALVVYMATLWTATAISHASTLLRSWMP